MQRKNNYRKLFFFLLLSILFGNLFYRIYIYREEYTKRFDAHYWEERYHQSQWVDPVSKNPIGDDGLYAYAGYTYINGQDPTLLNAELPPLGKYAIGLSILLFHNQNIFALLSGVFALLFFYFFNKEVFRDKVLALIPVTLFSFEPLFYTQLRAPFVDTFQLGFLFLTFLLFLRKRYVYMMIVFGALLSIKATSGIFVLVAGFCLLYLFLTKQFHSIKIYIFTLPLAVCIFLLSYLRYFLNGHTLREFLGVQKYIVNFYAKGAKANPFAVWQMLFTGSWPTHWGELAAVTEWSIIWSIILSMSFLAAILFLFHFRKNQNDISVLFILLWVSAYMIFLMSIAVWPRYLLLLLPFLYNLTIWLLSKSTRGKSLRQVE